LKDQKSQKVLLKPNMIKLMPAGSIGGGGEKGKPKQLKLKKSSSNDNYMTIQAHTMQETSKV